MTEFKATYSAEDNKLRLYADERLDADLYARVREAGFRWAPKQELFVAPKWSPKREDLCIELAGDIEAEQTTLVERAEAKAARFEGIATKRNQEAKGYADVADKISERFYMGQPILVGHHSERRARKDQERMHSAMDKSVKAEKAIGYWHYRASGVEHHANMKAAPRVIAGRIKTLLKELRDIQRGQNHAEKCVGIWSTTLEMEDGETFDKRVEALAGTRIDTGSLSYWDAYSELHTKKFTARQVAEKTLIMWERSVGSETSTRWLVHTLNRLGFERSRLGDVERYEADLTPAILQTFARTFGAEKPKATQDGEHWTITSNVTLPLPIANDTSLTQPDSAWRDMFVSLGYEVPVVVRRTSNKPKAAPLINPTMADAERLQAQWNAIAAREDRATTNTVTVMSQEQYARYSKGSYAHYSTVSLDEHGKALRHRRELAAATPVCRVRTCDGAGFYQAASVIVLNDKPSKALPITTQEHNT